MKDKKNRIKPLRQSLDQFTRNLDELCDLEFELMARNRKSIKLKNKINKLLKEINK